jgi:hypothetical protein
VEHPVLQPVSPKPAAHRLTRKPPPIPDTKDPEEQPDTEVGPSPTPAPQHTPVSTHTRQSNFTPTAHRWIEAKEWNERTEAWQKQLQEYQTSALENIAKGQELYAQTLRSFVESSSKRASDYSPNFTQIQASIDGGYDFAVELLNRQRNFTKSLLEAAASNNAS